jgi:hypothetical protein
MPPPDSEDRREFLAAQRRAQKEADAAAAERRRRAASREAASSDAKFEQAVKDKEQAMKDKQMREAAERAKRQPMFKRGGRVKKYAGGGSATFTALDEDGKPYIKTKTREAPDKSRDYTKDRKVSRNPTYFQGPLGLMTITPLDEDSKPYRSGSSRSTSDSPRVTRIKALDKDGKPPRNALSGLTDKEIDKLFESGDFRVGPGGVPKRPTEAQLDAVRERGGSVKKYASGGSVSSASKRADGCATKGKTRGKFV